MSYIADTLNNLIHQTAFFNITGGNLIMIVVACIFLYLAIAKQYEPLLLTPIAFGMLLVNIYPDIMAPIGADGTPGGLLYYFYLLDEWAIPVSKLEKILFPIVVTIVVCMILPTTAPLVGMLMLGNLFRESGVVRQLTDTASNALMYIVVILLGTSVGATTSAEAFLNWDTIKIVLLGLIAFMFGTAAGVLFGKLMCIITKGKVNPLIGSAGVSAVPMAARVSQKVGAEADPTNFLLMHAMGPNVAGVIGTAVAAGTFMAIFGVF